MGPYSNDYSILGSMVGSPSLEITKFVWDANAVFFLGIMGLAIWALFFSDGYALGYDDRASMMRGVPPKSILKLTEL